MNYTRTAWYVIVILDTLNITYDYARRLCRRTLENVVEKILELVRRISKAAADRSIHAHGLRKEPEILAPLPLDTSLSAFDDYEVINGTPVFILNERRQNIEEQELRSKSVPKTWDSFADAPSRQKTGKRVTVQPSTSRDPEESSIINHGLSSRKEEHRITCYAFSHDDKFFVCGRRDGSISVWDVKTGSLKRVLHGGHLFSVGDVAFRKDSPATLVSIDIHGWCVKWNLTTYTHTRIRCAPVWEDPLYVGTEFAVPTLSCDGRYLGFPVYVYVEPGRNNLPNIPLNAETGFSPEPSGSSEDINAQQAPLTRFYVVGYVYDLDVTPQGESENTNPVLVLPIRVNERLNFEDSMLDLMSFSHSARRLLLTTYELFRPYLVLWPDANKRSVESYKLPGSRGCFSQDDRYLVTWYGMTSSKEQFSLSSCYVWDLNSLSKVMGHERGVQWNHPYYDATNPLILTDPEQGVVHTCGFVRLGNHLGIASSSVSDTMKIVIWSLRSADPIHVLDTSFAFSDVSPHDLRALVRDLGQLDRVPGMKCVGISNNGLWVGAYSPIKKRGVIWNAYLGTEILRMTIPNGTVEVKSGMDFCFSETTTKMIMVGPVRSLLWDPCVLRSYNPADEPIYSLASRDEDMGMGETICRFSEDGLAVGLLRAESFCMDVWYFHPKRQFTLSRKEVRTEMSNPCNSRRRRPHLEMQAGKYRFGHFAISHNGNQVVTCMCDMSVLLWNTKELHQCRRIATLSSQYRPALDVCFSRTETDCPTVVICQDQGVFVWISLLTDEIIDRESSGGIMRCKFTSKGRLGIIMSNLYHLKIWNLVSRCKIKEVNYSIPLMRTVRGDFFHEHNTQFNCFHPKCSQDASFCLVGFRDDLTPIIAYPNTSPESLDESIWNPMDVVLSEDSEWAILMGKVDQETDDIALVEHRAPDFTNPILEEQYPPIIYDEEEDPNPVMAGPHTNDAAIKEFNQTFKIVHLKGTYKSKQMRLPYNLKTHKFLAVTEDGTKFAALNMSNKLVVWGTHFTYKHVIQQRWELIETGETSAPGYIERKLDEYGASLVNHPYHRGCTVLMDCVASKKVEMLKRIIAWAKDSSIHLSFHGLSISEDNETIEASSTNALDLAINSCAPHIAHIVLQALVQGATSETCLSRILENSLIRLSYKYPTLVLDFFRTSEVMKPICVINVSESYFENSSGYHGVLTDDTRVASTEYIQNLWTQKESKTQKILRQTNHLEIPAEAKVVPFPNIAKIGCEGLVQPLLLQNAQHFVFSTDLVKSVINYKYFEYARSLLLEDLYHHLTLLFTFTGNCIVVGYQEKSHGCRSLLSSERNESSGPIYTTVFATFVAFGSLIRLIMQVHTLWLEQGWSGLLYYAKNVQKWTELISCLLLVVAIPLVVIYCGFESEAVASLMAVTSVLLWVKLLFYAQAFKSTGPMVIMMREIIFDIRWFLFILFAFLVGFGIAFFVLLANTRKADNDGEKIELTKHCFLCTTSLFFSLFCVSTESPFGNPGLSMLVMFLLMLSEVGESTDEIHQENLAEGTKILAIIVLIIFLAAVAIVLLNLLIAIMGDSFDRVKNHEKSLFLQKRAEVILDMEMCLSYRRRQKFNLSIKRYLHVLSPHLRSSVYEHEWEGRLVDIQRRMREELLAISKRESHEFVGLRALLNEIRALVVTVLDEVQRKKTHSLTHS
eukprot:g3321.t1